MSTETIVALSWAVVALAVAAIYVACVVENRRHRARLKRFNHECTRLWSKLFSLQAGTPEYEAAWDELMQFMESEGVQ